MHAGNEGITAHYNNVALASLPANTSIFDTAHFFALFNVAQFDGRIAYFTMKYNNLFWRPITAAYQLIRYVWLQRMLSHSNLCVTNCKNVNSRLMCWLWMIPCFVHMANAHAQLEDATTSCQ